MRARRAPEETRLFWKVLLSPCVGPRTRCRPAPGPQLGVGAGWVTNSHFPAPTPWGCPLGMLPSPVPAPSTAGHWLSLEEWPSVGSKILGPTGAGAGHGLSLPPGGTRRDSTPGERPLASRLLQGDRARCDGEGGQRCPLQAQGHVLAPPASPWLLWMAGTLAGPTLWVPSDERVSPQIPAQPMWLVLSRSGWEGCPRIQTRLSGVCLLRVLEHRAGNMSSPACPGAWGAVLGFPTNGRGGRPVSPCRLRPLVARAGLRLEGAARSLCVPQG